HHAATAATTALAAVDRAALERDEPAPVPAPIVRAAEPRLPWWTSVRAAIRVEPWLPLFVLGWCCGVAVLTLRLLSGWLWVRRLASHGVAAASRSVAASVARLSRRLHIHRTITLLESTIVEVPTVIGWLKPVVLLPASALAGLTPEQLEAILAHELAHIRR